MSMPSRTLAPQPVRNTRRTAHPANTATAPRSRRAGERETVTALRRTTSRSQQGFPTWLAMIMMIPVALYALLVIPGASIWVVMAWAGVGGIIWAARSYSRAVGDERTRIPADRPGRMEHRTTRRPRPQLSESRM